TAHDPILKVESGSGFEVEFEFDALMAPGFYFLNVGVVEQEGKGINYLNRMLDVAMFRVQDDLARISTGQVNLNVAVRYRNLQEI
ncbi:MAG TPA: Wzt carbohydrate-binding domain-containing protein, partial [Nitrospira sp.]|nr:Wzt carbohydrate-binding domain-containing protein [Nitrospira sp.]